MADCQLVPSTGSVRQVKATGLTPLPLRKVHEASGPIRNTLLDPFPAT